MCFDVGILISVWSARSLLLPRQLLLSSHGVVSSTARMSAGLYLMLFSVLLSESRYTMNLPSTS
jgi:hypothetical protein